MATTTNGPSTAGGAVVRPARITREEIATPPEFADCRPIGHEAARVGGARIELTADRGPTRLGRCYQQIPIRLMPPFGFEGEPAALLYLITLTAGLLDGDAHLVQIHARRGSRAVVTGQSAARVHPSRGSFATQQWSAEVEDDAFLVVLPGPLIPYAASRYYQRSRADLAAGARLVWGDIWHAGRYARGELSERFAFDRIVQDFEVRRAGRLVYRERFRWDGPWNQEQIDWHVGGGLAAGSLVVAGPVPDDLAFESPGVRAARLPLDADVTCLRWCGPPAAVTTALVRAASTIAGSWTGGPGASPWLLDSTELSPNHWFSKPPAVV
jgi:urease accessory protein